MGLSGNKKDGFKSISLGYAKKVTMQSYDEILMPNTVIYWVNILSQVQTNDLDLLGCNNHLNRELNIIGVDYGETDLPHIDLVEP